MVRKFQSLPVEQREHMRGGDGTVTLTPGLQAGDYAATVVAVGPGDSTVTRSGECHSIRNTGDTPLELLAIIATL